MSEKEFARAFNQNNELSFDSKDRLSLSAKQKQYIEQIIEAHADKVADYKYSSKDAVIARTGIQDLKDTERRGVFVGIVDYTAAFYYLARRTTLGQVKASRRFLHIGSFLVGSAAFFATTQHQYNKYRSLSGHLNTRISQEFSDMMSLKKAGSSSS